MRRLMGTLLLGTVMAIPVVVVAADQHDRAEANRAERYYDKDAKTYHEWNDQEERAYRHWWDETHHKGAFRKDAFRDFDKLRDRDRRAYWRWRRQHSEAY
jgi:hypothetical protein